MGRVAVFGMMECILCFFNRHLFDSNAIVKTLYGSQGYRLLQKKLADYLPVL